MAGGEGSRLYPLTKVITKQLLPIHNKPMIYYPLSTLMLMGINEILIITAQDYNESFKNLLGNGEEYGIKIEYKIQKTPSGIAEGLIIAEDFIKGSQIALILGDNFFYGDKLGKRLNQISDENKNAVIFGVNVNNPEEYGIAVFDKNGLVIDIQEKPIKPKSNWAITGLYFYENSVIEIAKSLKKSLRGELEVTDINKLYLKQKNINIKLLGRGVTWFDAGSFETLNNASNFVQTIENRNGSRISCLEEIAWRKNWINDKKLIDFIIKYKNSPYGDYLLKTLERGKEFDEIKN